MMFALSLEEDILYNTIEIKIPREQQAVDMFYREEFRNKSYWPFYKTTEDIEEVRATPKIDDLENNSIGYFDAYEVIVSDSTPLGMIQVVAEETGK
jgi:hypothetical protein